jgi:hypothetical protein
MRRLLFYGAVAAALLLADARTEASAGAWCAWYDPSTYNCGFRTYQQCLWTISGAGGMCRPNHFEPQRPEAGPRYRKRPRYR